jgi:3-hydroxybutyryl-CoA dehydrogenase
MKVDAHSPAFTVGVIGAGTMGRGIMQVAAVGGLRVLALDSKPGAAEAARSYIAKILDGLVEKKKMAAHDAAAAIGRIEIVNEVANLADSDLVVEVIVEDLGAKQQLFSQLDSIVKPDCILATNTSSLSVTAIAAPCKQPGRVAGFHFFNPVPLMRLVEVIAGVKTEPWAIEALMAIGRRMGKEPVLAKDSPGFLVNHVGRAYVPESLRLLAEGIAQPQDIDQVMRDAAGFRMGPFELADLVGMDVAHPVMESIYAQYYQEPMYQPSPLARVRMTGGLLGRKTLHGFYRYEDNKPVTLPTEPPPTARPKSIWVSSGNREGHTAITALLKSLDAPLEGGARPSGEALCVTTPFGIDATTSAVAENLDPARTVAVDTLLPLDRRRTLMVTPVTDPAYRDAAHGLLGSDGVPVTLINDSPGFIAQRIIAMIVNVGCNIAQQRVASPKDIDTATKLGLNYPFGPLELGDRVGPRRILQILESLCSFYGEPRYRPMPWLKRRAALGVSLLVPDNLQ